MAEIDDILNPESSEGEWIEAGLRELTATMALCGMLSNPVWITNVLKSLDNEEIAIEDQGPIMRAHFVQTARLYADSLMQELENNRP